MEIPFSILESFSAEHSSEEDPVLRELAEYTRSVHREHHMLSGHLQGRFLEMVSRMMQPSRILEIGTFTGYSAICLARGLKHGGILHTLEKRSEEAAIARRFFEKAGLSDRIHLHIGDAREILTTLAEPWDLVFIDADKTGYIDYFNLVLPQVRQNGYIFADNIFFHGQALEKEPTGKNAKAIQAFNNHIRETAGIETLVLTLRDGLFLIRKK